MAGRDGSIKSVLKGLDILEHLAAAGGPVSVSQVGRAKGFHVTTAHRLLRTLALRGYVAQEPGNHAYRLGSRVLQLGRAYLESLDVVAIARPRLEALRDALGETTHLAVYSDGEAVELAQAPSQQPISVSIRPGQRSPAYCTALGKVLLAGLPPAELQRFLRQARLDRRAPRTITDPRALERELERVRSRGWAIDEEEFAAKLCCVAVPVRDASGATVAALSVAMPEMRYRTARVAHWTRRLARTALDISRELGFSGKAAG
ncbi:MAG: IclR family transcriptional regulator [Betaproteobacteria bacterium]